MSNTTRNRIAEPTGQDQLMQQPKGQAANRTRLLIVIPLSLMLIYALITIFNRLGLAEAAISRERLIIATVERGKFVRDISATGQVVAAISPTLYSTATGTVTFKVKSGTQVDVGQVLAIIDSPETRNLLQQEEATFEALTTEFDREQIQSKIQQLQNSKTIDLTKIRLTAAKREMRRAEAAWKQKNISAIDYEKAQDDLENAELEFKHAQADALLDDERLEFEVRTKSLQVERQKLQVANLSREVDELSIRSPVNGIVGNLLIDQKSNVAANTAVLSVVDLTIFEVEIQIAESYADELGIGMETEIRIDGQLWNGQLVAISPEIINNQVTGRVSFIGDKPTSLRANQRASTRILLEERDDVLMLRRGQFVSETGGKIAYRIRDDIAYRSQLEIGSRSITHIEILSGAEQDEQFIISSLVSFKDSETVLITE